MTLLNSSLRVLLLTEIIFRIMTIARKYVENIISKSGIIKKDELQQIRFKEGIYRERSHKCILRP